MIRAWGRGWSHTEMPLARYFVFVGGVLLALLFVVGAVLPQLPDADADRTGAGVDKSIIRIHSDRKWPERVVFDTSLPTIVPAQTLKAEAAIPAPAPTIVADVPPKTRVREAFAQLVPPEPKKPEPKLQKLQRKPKIAKNHAAPPPMVMVAQQPRFGFFANSTW
jgi:hypothetical protein